MRRSSVCPRGPTVKCHRVSRLHSLWPVTRHASSASPALCITPPATGHHPCSLLQGIVYGVKTEETTSDPALVNRDPMGDGWFFKVHVTHMEQFDELMDPPAYDKLLKAL